MEIVLAALVTQLGALVLVLVQQQKHRTAVDALTQKVQTNHGKEPFEYLEMIADVKAGQDRMVEVIADHTVNDTLNFAVIEARLKRIESAVATQ